MERDPDRAGQSEREQGTARRSGNLKKKITVCKSGGTASKNALIYRLTVPAEMIRAIGVTPEDRSVELDMVGDTLTIRKTKKEE